MSIIKYKNGKWSVYHNKISGIKYIGTFGSKEDADFVADIFDDVTEEQFNKLIGGAISVRN